MRETNFRVPLFTTIVSVAMVLVGLVFALGFFTKSRALFPNAPWLDLAPVHLMFMIGTRNLTMSLALLIALALKSRAALVATLAMRTMTETLDLVANLGDHAGNGRIVIIALMIVAELSALALLLRTPRAENKTT